MKGAEPLNPKDGLGITLAALLMNPVVGARPESGTEDEAREPSILGEPNCRVAVEARWLEGEAGSGPGVFEGDMPIFANGLARFGLLNSFLTVGRPGED